MQLTLYFVVVFILLKTTVNGEVEETDESKHGLDVEPSGHEYQPGRLQGQAIIADNRRRGRRTRCKKFNDKGECAWKKDHDDNDDNWPARYFEINVTHALSIVFFYTYLQKRN